MTKKTVLLSFSLFFSSCALGVMPNEWIIGQGLKNPEPDVMSSLRPNISSSNTPSLSESPRSRYVKSPRRPSNVSRETQDDTTSSWDHIDRICGGTCTCCKKCNSRKNNTSTMDMVSITVFACRVLDTFIPPQMQNSSSALRRRAGNACYGLSVLTLTNAITTLPEPGDASKGFFALGSVFAYAGFRLKDARK